MDLSNSAQTMVLPALGPVKALHFDLGVVREAETRLKEVKDVNPVTYVDLEHTFNEAYRELKRFLADIGYQITVAEKEMEQAKASVLIDKYPEFMTGRPKSQDNADMRKAFLMRDSDYVLWLDRISQLKAMEAFFDGKIKVMERTSSYMKVRMNLIMRSGLSNANLYETHGRK